MIFRQLFDNVSSTYSYVLASRRGGEALIIDPVLEKVDRYLKLMEELDLRLVKAIDTHLHADHITGLGALRDRTHCVTVMGEQSKVDVVSMRVAEGDRLTIEGFSLDALYTPGHTDDSYSFVCGDRVFTGDTLLIRGTGRTDFQNGDSRAQWESLQRLLRLPDETLIFPAHDYKGDTVSTIAEEKRFNPRLAVRNADEYAALMGSLHLPNPKLMDVAVPANIHQGLHQEEVARRGWAFTAEEAKGLLGRADVALIDLREKSEREKRGAIPHSPARPLSRAHGQYRRRRPHSRTGQERQDDRVLLRFRRTLRDGRAGRTGQGPGLRPPHRGRNGRLAEGGRQLAAPAATYRCQAGGPCKIKCSLDPRNEIASFFTDQRKSRQNRIRSAAEIARTASWGLARAASSKSTVASPN